MEENQTLTTPPSPSQFHSPNPNNNNSIFKDISNNYKTPKQNPNFTQSPIPRFFTASKQTPTTCTSSFRRNRTSLAPPPPTSRSKAARRLKQFELEQSQSSRKAQIKKQNSLKSLSKAFTVWLNFLFQNPRACNCEGFGEGSGEDESRNGKRDSWPGRGFGISIDGGSWRSSKRHKEGFTDLDLLVGKGTEFSSLKTSLEDVCSFDDLKQRMRGYLNADGCKEVFKVMSKVTKNIDEGRLKMRAHCPIVTDVRLKEQAIRVLMCYNPLWLRIGMYIVFGGDLLLPNGDVSSDQELAFLKVIVEKQLFVHTDLAKTYAYNKAVEGLYRPGYFEALGNVVLKRFLLLVLILDRAKAQSSLPIKYGIDGIDGGSPLLFGRESNIKSSRQLIHDFLSSEIMHGEGNLLAHLVIVGYKVSYEQSPLLDYDFTVKDLFDDLQDGVRLCRAIQLLKCDTSILMKVVVPSDTHKKNLVNCGVALQYLKQAEVPLCDEDGFVMVPQDVASGEKELTLSMLWNIFVHLQLPLLVSKTMLFEEICKVKEVDMDHSKSDSSNLLEVVLQWIRAICLKYDLTITDYASLLDGKALWCLIDYYIHNELHCSSFCKKATITGCRDPNVLPIDCSDAVHNFILSQKLATMLGSFPEVLQTSDILEHRGVCSERSVTVLLAFLSSQLIGRKIMDHVNIHKLLGCNRPSLEVKRLSLDVSSLRSEALIKVDGLDACNTEEKASITIQSIFKGLIARRKFVKMKTATSYLQMVVRAWLSAKITKVANSLNFPISRQLYLECQKHPYLFGQHLTFMVERHSFIKLRKSALVIQQAARTWIYQRRYNACKSDSEVLALSGSGLLLSPRSESKFIHREKEVKNIKMKTLVTVVIAWRRFRNSIIRKHIAATKIQCLWRGWFTRRTFLHQKKAIVMIQSALRSFKCWRDFQQYRIANKSAIVIQSHFRGLVRRRETDIVRQHAILIQSHWRGSLIRRDYLYQREAAKAIQSGIRCLKSCREFQSYRLAAIEIQRLARGQVARYRLLGASFYRSSGCMKLISSTSTVSFELKVFLYSVMKLQRWWRRVLLLKLKTRATITIQSHIRGWIARQRSFREKHRITVIQSYWRGYRERKESKGHLLDLRLRVQRSCSNVDDGMRLINRLVSALSELLNIRSIRSILHTCSTLDLATTHSQRCAETLVAAGAVDTLLKLIRSLSRSIPDQEVLKHALCTLRNISRYPHLADVLIDSERSIETILREMLRNKDEAYFIASDILKTLCSTKKGVDAAFNSPALLKRLQSHVHDLNRKVNVEKRKPRGVPAKDFNEKRFREANDLLKLICS